MDPIHAKKYELQTLFPLTILFVVNNFSPRVVKIAKALKKSGKEVIIFLDAKMKNPEWIKF